MQSQSSQEIKRYGAKIVGALGKAGKFIRQKASEIGEEASQAAGEVKKELKDYGVTLKTEVLPKAQEKLESASKAVRAHGNLTARRVAAEVNELVKTSEVLNSEKAREFELVKMVVNQKVSLRPLVKEYIKSDAALMSDFDNSKDVARGVPLFPKLKNLLLLKGEFIPVRIYIGPKGLTTRVYHQSDGPFESSSKPQYVLKSERPTEPEDLFQLRLNAQEVTDSLKAMRESEAFIRFVATRSY